MKTTKIQKSKVSKFFNNEITKKQSTKIKGGEDNDFIITEDCIDL